MEGEGRGGKKEGKKEVNGREREGKGFYPQ